MQHHGVIYGFQINEKPGIHTIPFDFLERFNSLIKSAKKTIN